MSTDIARVAADSASLSAWFHRAGGVFLLRQMARSIEVLKKPGSRLPRLGRVSSAKFVVLCYHRVGIDGVPYYSRLAPEVFEQQVRSLRQTYTILPLREICERIQRGDTAGQGVAITFDDGYREVLTAALPILQKYQVPATVFLTVNAIETGECSWYDRIFAALRTFPKDEFQIGWLGPDALDLRPAGSRTRAAEAIIGWMRTLPNRTRIEMCTIFEGFAPPPSDPLRDRMLSWEEVRSMRKAGIEIGSHSLTHPSVGHLDAEELESELGESKRIIEQRLREPIEAFAYPFGKPSDCGDGAAEVLRKHGYHSAATTVWGINGTGVDTLSLRRVLIGEDNGPHAFAVKLARLFLEPVTLTSGQQESQTRPSLQPGFSNSNETLP